MMDSRLCIYIALAVAAVAGLGGGYLGYQLAHGACVDRLLDQTNAALDVQNDAISRANARGLAERTRAVAAAERRTKQTHAAQEVSLEISKLPDRPVCEWSADERLRFDDLYRAYGYAGRTSAPVVRNTMPTSAGQ
ncbi:MAG: hypothetical protein RBT75_20205 [Anaerolineae bacterium]|jgi:hypothetical protein|nr:hypothetical protein [Anaerolineae bacterium]